MTVSLELSQAQTAFTKDVAHLLRVLGEELPPQAISRNLRNAVAKVLDSATKVEEECSVVKQSIVVK